MIHPGLYNLICADGVLVRVYGQSKYPRILRLRLYKDDSKLEVYDKRGLLLPVYWSLFRL